MNMLTIDEIKLNKKRIFIRSDLNVPMQGNKITSYARILASLPTIYFALKHGGKVIIASHFNRPKEGKYEEKYSLYPVVKYLKKNFFKNVRLVKDYLNGFESSSEELIILENVRFNNGEKENNDILAKKYASLCDIFVMDAFGVIHRKEASIYGIAKFSSVACAGFLLKKEIQIIKKSLENPSRPMSVIIGGSKISTKLNVLKKLSKIADKVIVGGGVANTLIAANGNNIGKSIYEKNLFSKSKKLLESNRIIVPIDVCVSKSLDKNALSKQKFIKDIKDDDYILDIGNKSIEILIEILKKSKTILWSGPIGMFELDNFKKGTEATVNAIAKSNAFSIVGGGDTVAAIEKFKISGKISYLSTGGGSFLKYIEGNDFPIMNFLKKS